ncbi:hypothetical protein MNBD_GAMMA22-2554 [hydrothermal vent metagenome]|uniref:Uncharacterized protein n=1 Tax=hydrothermal vent metagenome TaxID=652676 RepID=A0A3B1AMN3_9ZZZZ
MKNYLITLLSGIFIFLTIIGSFNWLINPFDYLSSPVIDGLNVHKPKIRERMTKVYKTSQIKPATIILGSSRSLNMPVQHSSFINLPVYNLSLASGSGYEMYRMFQQAHVTRPLKTVIIGLDEKFTNGIYTNFNENRFDVDRDGNANIKRYMQYWYDVYNSILSIDAIKASLSTIKKQSYYSQKNLAVIDMKNRVSKAGGHHQMFGANENKYLGKLSTIQQCHIDAPMPTDKSIIEVTNNLKYLKKMLETAYHDSIEFKIFFSPIHARLQTVNCVKDAGQSIEQFKYAVVTLVESLATTFQKKPFIVMDFSGYNTITTEAVPPIGDKTTLMKWYWEGSHYTSATAELMLDKLAGLDKLGFDDFGVKLEKNTIVAHFQKQRQLQLKYQKNHPRDINEIQQRAQKNLK